MTRPAVFITNRVHPEVIAFLEEFARVDANPNSEPLPHDLYVDRISRADAIMVFMNDSLNARMLEKCPNLRIVAAALKGADNFEVAACTERGIWFTIVPDLLTIPTAELAIALALALSRKVLEGDRIVRSGTFGGWRPALYGAGFSGRTAGIVGMGNLGKALAKRLAAFDMKMLYVDPAVLPQQADVSLIASRVDLAELLAASDFIFLTLPLSSETLHLFGTPTLAHVKPGSFLVNVSRGSVVDEQAVAAALTAGTLAGYAADVFEMEDCAREDQPTSICPALLKQTGKTLFTPHLGSAVAEIRLKIEMRAARNIAEAFSGRRPPDAINEPRHSR